jgi:hypothetical protein
LKAKMKKFLAPRREDSASDGAFRLSRIYAEGWNTAKRMPLIDGAGFDAAGNPALNPYRTEPQRSRWAEGFAKAMGNPQT